MSMRGRKHSEETRVKMSASKIGHAVSEETRAKMRYALAVKRARKLALLEAQGEVMSEKLPDDREGATLHFKILSRGEERTDGSADVKEVDGYLTLNLNPDGRTLREIFVRVGKPGDSDAMFDEWAKQASNRLQEGCTVEQVFKTHVGTRFGDSGKVQCVKGFTSCTSVLDLIARIVIQRFGAKEAA